MQNLYPSQVLPKRKEKQTLYNMTYIQDSKQE